MWKEIEKGVEKMTVSEEEGEEGEGEEEEGQGPSENKCQGRSCPSKIMLSYWSSYTGSQT